MDTTIDHPQVTVTPYRGELYEPVKPQADCQELIDTGRRRLILYHKGNRSTGHTAELRIAPKGLLCAGFAIGLVHD